MNVVLHPAMSHAQAMQVLRTIGAKVEQDKRGWVRLVPVATAPGPDDETEPEPEAA